MYLRLVLITSCTPRSAHTGLHAELPRHVQLPAADPQHRLELQRCHLPPLDGREPGHAERQRPGHRPELGEQERLRGDAQLVDAHVATTTAPVMRRCTRGGRLEPRDGGGRCELSDEVRHPIVAAVDRGFSCVICFLCSSYAYVLAWLLRITGVWFAGITGSSSAVLTGFGIFVFVLVLAVALHYVMGYACSVFASRYRTRYRTAVPAWSFVIPQLAFFDVSVAPMGYVRLHNDREFSIFIFVEWNFQRHRRIRRVGVACTNLPESLADVGWIAERCLGV